MRAMSLLRLGGAVTSTVLALVGLTTSIQARDGQDSVASAHSFAFTSIDGHPLSLGQFAGKAVLVVNTASQCGFTKQYDDLQALWERYRDRGLIVLGVPSNDFGGQEPGSEADIKEFCEVNFAVDFPMTAKQQVTGALAHPFYRWAAAQLGPGATPKWNFHKYLLAADGRLVTWFSTLTRPTAPSVIDAIEKHLPAAAPASAAVIPE